MAQKQIKPRCCNQTFVTWQKELPSWDCGGDLGPNSSYAARPKSLRYCMGLLQSRSPFILASLYHLRQASSMSMNSPIVTPAQPQPWMLTPGDFSHI